MGFRVAVALASICTLGVVAVVGLLFFWAVFHELEPLTGIDTPRSVDRAVYAPGDTVRVLTSYTKHTNAPLRSTIQLRCTNGSGPAFLPILTFEGPGSPPGRVENLEAPIMLPENAPLGSECFIEFIAYYRVNPIAERETYSYTESFAIIAAVVDRLI